MSTVSPAVTATSAEPHTQDCADARAHADAQLGADVRPGAEPLADVHLAAATELRTNAMHSVSRAYAATHGHPLEHNTEVHRGIAWTVPTKVALIVVSVLAVIAAVIGGFQLANRPSAAAVVTIQDTDGEVGTDIDAHGAALGDGDVDAIAAADGEAGSSHTDTPVVEQIIVHVAGQVAHPQVVTIAANSRVIDAVNAAGGPLPSADLDAINLARPIVDGEQIYIPAPGEVAPQATHLQSPQAPGGGAPDEASRDGTTSSTGAINLNTATAAELESLPGIGPALAQRIIDHRAERGGFTSAEQIRQVSGIGPKVFEKLKNLITI